MFTKRETTPAQRVLEEIQAINASLFATLDAKLAEAYAKWWNNPEATPQELAAAAGAGGTTMFAIHAALVAVVAQVAQNDGLPMNAPTSIPEGWTLGIAADGSLDLTPPVVVPEPEQPVQPE